MSTDLYLFCWILVLAVLILSCAYVLWRLERRVADLEVEKEEVRHFARSQTEFDEAACRVMQEFEETIDEYRAAIREPLVIMKHPAGWSEN